MGRFSWPHWWRCRSCFRANFIPNHDYPLHNLPKPQSADIVDNSPPYENPEEDVLIIRSIDPCISHNGPLHHTEKYEIMKRKIDPQLVVRRGHSFRLMLVLSRPYNPKIDGISFIFSVDDEERLNYGNGTLVAVPLRRRPNHEFFWNVVLESTFENTMTVEVQTDPGCIVAKWKLEVDTKIIDNGAYSYSWDTNIYILFNPWGKHDQVHMKSEEWKEESVLNDYGIIWRGTFNRKKPVVWKYDQFEEKVLECAIYLMREVGRVKGSARGDPVKTARALSAAVNSADDDGAVLGNWTQDHSGGTHPTKWLGSREILQQYYKKKKPVKYGQCWVFAGVLTTVCRALGIPARTVTCYSSAHDTQGSLTVDYFVDDKGEIMEELNSDSIWNFHVWNEVWMQRPDLGKDYFGWQAIDATPQESSDNMFRVGPSSTVAVKQGEVLRPYDNGFVFAEVNADKIFWKYAGPTQPLKLLSKDIYAIGKLVCTKAPSLKDYIDITHSYKHPERTGDERSTMLKALKQSESLFARYYLNEEFNDIHFNFQLKDDIKIGQPFSVGLTMKNRSHTKEYRVWVLLKVDVVTYMGQVGKSVKRQDFDVVVKPDSIYEVSVDVVYEEYSKRLIDQSAFNISCLANVKDTDFDYFAQDDFRVRKPDIKIVLHGTPVENNEITADISIENPLPVPLRKGEFTIDAPGFKKALKLKVKTVPPGEYAKEQFSFTPPRKGQFTVAAKFVSKEMDDCDGFIVFFAKPAKEENNTLTNEVI